MLRFGKISSIDSEKCYARVKFTDDGIVSDWLQIIVLGAISNQFFHIFDINEQVACIMDDNSEEGVIIGAVFNDKKSPSNGDKDLVSVKFSDNSLIEYNRASHEYTINVKGKINITSEGETNIVADSVTVQATNMDITAAVSVTGDLTVSGVITANGEITSGSIGLTTHKHIGVTAGGGTSGIPTP